MKKQSLAILASGVSLALLFPSCGSSSAPTESPPSAPADEAGQQTIEGPVAIIYYNSNASGSNKEAPQKMYEAFHEEYPNITVGVETIAMGDYLAQMRTRMAGDAAPGYYELNIENFISYANKGVLVEISGVDLSRLDETTLGAFNMDSKQCGLPGDFSNMVSVYNEDLFDRAGIDYPTADWTQDDVQMAAEAIRTLGDDTYGYYQPLIYNESYRVYAQFGGSLLNEDKTELTINSPENTAAAQMMTNRVLANNVRPTGVQIGGMGDQDLFMSNRLDIIPTGIWAFQPSTDGCDFNWDITIKSGQEQKAAHFFSNGLAINADNEHKDAAATWITWPTPSPAAVGVRIEVGWDLPAVNDEDTLVSYLDTTPPDGRQVVLDSLDYLMVLLVIEDYALMSDTTSQKLPAAANDSITIREAPNQAQSERETQISPN